jgi:hypothetical protein
MAIIYSYPTVTPEKTDLVLGTDVSVPGKPTKNFTVQSIIDLVTTATGDLQFVLNLGNTASGVDINLTNNSFRGGGFVTTAGATVSGTTGTGFTNITSTEFTGTIATPAQPNITSLGTLSALVISGPISGTGLITNSNLTGAQNDNVVSTLAIKTYVDNKVGLYDTLQEVLANGNTTGGSDIVVSAGDDVTFTDTSKILMGSTAVDNFEIYSDSANSIVIDRSPGALKLQTSLLSVRDEADTTQTISASAAGAVELYHAGDKKIETLTGGAKVTGAFQATTSGTFASLVNTGTYTDSSGDVGTAGQLLSSTGSGTNWVTELPLYTWSLEGTTIPSGTAVTVTDGTNITTTWDATNFDLTIATTGVPDGSGAANQVTYWSDADTLTGAAGFTFAGGATGKVAIAGELEVGGVLTDGTFTGSAGTYTGYVSITSTDFVGALTGNASTATALAASGAIALTGDTTSTGGPYTYTSGGALNIATTIADTTVTGKVLTNLPTPTSSAIAATDTILAAMGKLQGQIDGLAGSLSFEGTWNASTDTPTLSGTTPANGVFYIVSVAGNTNLDGITDWQVGDWAIYVDNGAGTDAWQKLDQSNEVLGSGAANKIAKWTSTNTLATGLIEDDGTDVTVGNSGNLIVEGNTTLGDADTDTTTVKGPGVFEETAQFNVGIGLSSTPDYGTAGQVLTSGGGSATANTWTTPTTGTVTSVAASIDGDSLSIAGSPVTSSGTLAFTFQGNNTQYINGAGDLTTFPTLDNYQYWVLSDGTNTTNINSTDTATFIGASGITVAESSGTITITGSAQPGTGTQYTLPVWSTTTSLGDSMVSQNAGGTELTVSGSATIDSTTATLNIKGSDTGASLINFADASDGNVGRIYYDHTDNFMQFKADDGVRMLIANGKTVLGSGDATLTATNHNVLAIKASETSVIEMVGDADANFETVGHISFINTTNPVTTYNKRIADIYAKRNNTQQTGKLEFWTTQNTDSIPKLGLTIDSGQQTIIPEDGRLRIGNSGYLYENSNNDFTVSGSTSDGYGIIWELGKLVFDGRLTSPNSTADFVTIDQVAIDGSSFNCLTVGNSTSYNSGAGTSFNTKIYGNLEVEGTIVGKSSGRKTNYVRKNVPSSSGWVDMFSLNALFVGIISDIFATKESAISTRQSAIGFYVAQAGGTSSSTANAPVYNKIIDTGDGQLELQFLAYNASTNNHGYKCQARTTNGGDVQISVCYSNDDTYSTTFTDLT